MTPRLMLSIWKIVKGLILQYKEQECPKKVKTHKFKRIERMMDAPFTCYVDAEGFTKKINEKRGTNTTAIQEHEPSGLDYIIIRSDGQFKAPVQIRGADPAGDFIKAMEKK